MKQPLKEKNGIYPAFVEINLRKLEEQNSFTSIKLSLFIKKKKNKV